MVRTVYQYKFLLRAACTMLQQWTQDPKVVISVKVNNGHELNVGSESLAFAYRWCKCAPIYTSRTQRYLTLA